MSGRQQYLAPIGADQIGIGILGESVRGVTIDNPSGCWLLVLPEYDYVPPYTLGWSRSYVAGLANITIRWAGLTPNFPTPAGQISTQQGDGATIVLTSEPVTDSAGIPQGGGEFIEQFTPTVPTFLQTTWTVTPVNAVWLPAVAGKRYRVLSAQLVYSGGGGSNDYSSAARATLSSTLAPNLIIPLRVSGAAYPIDKVLFQPGIDYPMSAGIQVARSAEFANVDCELATQTQLI